MTSFDSALPPDNRPVPSGSPWEGAFDAPGAQEPFEPPALLQPPEDSSFTAPPERGRAALAEPRQPDNPSLPVPHEISRWTPDSENELLSSLLPRRLGTEALYTTLPKAAVDATSSDDPEPQPAPVPMEPEEVVEEPRADTVEEAAPPSPLAPADDTEPEPEPASGGSGNEPPHISDAPPAVPDPNGEEQDDWHWADAPNEYVPSAAEAASAQQVDELFEAVAGSVPTPDEQDKAFNMNGHMYKVNAHGLCELFGVDTDLHAGLRLDDLAPDIITVGVLDPWDAAMIVDAQFTHFEDELQRVALAWNATAALMRDLAERGEGAFLSVGQLSRPTGEMAYIDQFAITADDHRVKIRLSRDDETLRLVRTSNTSSLLRVYRVGDGEVRLISDNATQRFKILKTPEGFTVVNEISHRIDSNDAAYVADLHDLLGDHLNAMYDVAREAGVDESLVNPGFFGPGRVELWEEVKDKVPALHAAGRLSEATRQRLVATTTVLHEALRQKITLNPNSGDSELTGGMVVMTRLRRYYRLLAGLER